MRCTQTIAVSAVVAASVVLAGMLGHGAVAPEAPDGEALVPAAHTRPYAGPGVDPGDGLDPRGGPEVPVPDLPLPTVAPGPSLPPLPPTVTAYVWADRPTTGDYHPHPDYAYNSTGGDVRVGRVGTGEYVVVFEDAGARGGVAHAVAYGKGNEFCTVTFFGQGKDGQYVRVRCFGPDGEPADTRFVANFTNAGHAGDGRLAYFWTDEATPDGERTLDHPYQYDSRGGPISYRREAVGTYHVDFEGKLPIGFEEKVPYAVTAYNRDAVHCQPAPPEPHVVCVDDAGDRVDSRFVATYTSRVDVLGHATSDFGEVAPTERRFGDLALGVGRYEVTFPDAGTRYGHAMAGAVGVFGDPREYCTVAGWAPDGNDQVVRVRCFGFDGKLKEPNYQFQVFFTDHPRS